LNTAETIINKRYLTNIRKLKEARPFWRHANCEILADRLTADAIKWEDIEAIPKPFFDEFEKVKSMAVENGTETTKQMTAKAIAAFNAYNTLIGRRNDYTKNELLDVCLKEVVKGKDMRGIRYIGFLTNDGRKFRWMLN